MEEQHLLATGVSWFSPAQVRLDLVPDGKQKYNAHDRQASHCAEDEWVMKALLFWTACEAAGPVGVTLGNAVVALVVCLVKDAVGTVCRSLRFYAQVETFQTDLEAKGEHVDENSNRDEEGLDHQASVEVRLQTIGAFETQD